jgi:predicted dehydrogenase
MYERAEALGVKHMTYFCLRWYPHFQYVRELIDHDFIGSCYDVHVQINHGYGRGNSGWRYDRSRSNGVVGDLGSHASDLTRWFVGEIETATGYTGIFEDRTDPDNPTFIPANDSAAIALKFSDGAQGTIQLSSVARLGDRGIEVNLVLHGEKGTIETQFSTGGMMEVRGITAEQKHFKVLEIPNRFWGSAERTFTFFGPTAVFTTLPVAERLFIDSVLENKTVSPTFYDGMKAQEVIESIGRDS